MMLRLRSVPVLLIAASLLFVSTLASEEEDEQGILLPPEDKYNFVGEDPPPKRSSEVTRRNRADLPSTVQISSNGFQIREGSSQSPTISTKPLPIVTSSGRPSTVFVNNNCFGQRCPQSPQQRPSGTSSSDDSSASYHYVLNKDVPKRKWRRPSPLRDARQDTPRTDKSTKRSLDTHVHLSLPFVVDPVLKDSRTSHNPSYVSPGWVKLHPVLPDQYDLFTLKNTTPGPQGHPQGSFSDRLGVELSPDSFASRWGWGGAGNDGRRPIEGSSGTRLPPWLQDIHNTRITNTRHPSRDNDSKWVKLDPIAVAGVSISKWVAKGTPQEDLPSTGWPTRDTQRPLNSIPWWEQIDKQRPSSYPSSYPPSSSGSGHRNNNRPFDILSPQMSPQMSSGGWGSVGGGDRTPTNAWDEVIYPEGPTSATASWQKDKDFLSGQKYSGGHFNSLRRPPTGSWSADPFQGHQSAAAASSDDPRWVLVSNSRKVTVDSRPPLPSSLQVGSYPHLRPDPPFDYPFYNPHRDSLRDPAGPHRNGKDFKGRLQDEAFSRVNATLANLEPVLNLRGSKSKGLRGQLESNSTSSPTKLPAFLKAYASEEPRGHGDLRNRTVVTLGGSSVRKGLSINPVYAAVGAGMIPATMAAVLPMVLGRRRRSLRSPRAPPPLPDRAWWTQ